MQTQDSSQPPVSENLEESKFQDQTKETFNNPLIPKIYANSYLAGTSSSDAYIILQTNGMPTAVLNMSYTFAKSLQQTLGRMISEFEATTDHEIMVMREIKKKREDKKSQDL